MSDNVRTLIDTSAESYVRQPYFVHGYNDYVDGVWEERYECWDPRRQWFYEVGRLFAAMGGEISSRSAPAVLIEGIMDGSIPMQYNMEELEKMRTEARISS